MIELFWWSRRKLQQEEKENFGDLLGPFLLDILTTKGHKWVLPNNSQNFFFRRKQYFTIGSILHFANENSVVWGSGIIKWDSRVNEADFRAVRGPLTRKKLITLGYSVPEKYGDPALLLALFFRDQIRKKQFKLGIIPHFVDYDSACEKYKGRSDVKIINVLTLDPEETIEEILQCKFILSSSLHGIIASHAVGIPALWTKISNNLYGDNIKFYDYYLSIGVEEPVVIPFEEVQPLEISEIFERYRTQSILREEQLNRLISDLIETFPFKKSKEFKNRIDLFEGNFNLPKI